MTEKLNSFFLIFSGCSVFVLDTLPRLADGASAKGAAAGLFAVVATFRRAVTGFWAGLMDFGGEAGFFKNGLLIFKGDECQLKRPSIAFH